MIKEPAKYLQADEMSTACITCLAVTYKNALVRTGNATATKSIQAIYFRVYPVVNKTGFIKTIKNF